MKKLFWMAGILLLPFLPAQAQKKVQVVKKTNDTTVTIPFSKYRLKNGLTVIIHEDHSDPVVHVDVTYHVGSNREEIGKSGFAHFFEHMMFQGSEHVGDEQHFKIVTEAGGTLNGTTNRDRTNYFETLPKNQLETALWLEADRMGFLLDSVTQQKFEVQRATVKNERGQNYDNRPYGLVSEMTSKHLYPYGHPYSWLTIGYVEDLDRVSVEDLKKFFLRWYGPNNATITIGGDVNTKEALKLVNKYFGSIPAGPKVENLPAMVPALESNRYISMEDNIRFPMLRVTYPTVPFFHKDEAALDILSYLLGTGKNSVLYQRLEKTGIVYRADNFHSSYELSGEMAFSLMAYPDSSLSGLENRLNNILSSIGEIGFTDEDLIRAKASILSSTISSLETVNGKVRQLAFYQTFTGNPNQIQATINAYEKVTREDLMRVFKTYILGKPAVVLSVYPKGKVNKTAADNHQVTATELPKGKDQYAKLNYKKAKDKFDRSKRPEVAPDQGGPIPMVWEANLEGNSIPIKGIQNTEIPYVRLMLVIKGGHLMDAKYPGKEGLANLTAIMKNQSSYNMSVESLQKEMEKYGSSISFSASEDAIVANVSCLKKYLPFTLGLFQEMLLNSKFDAKEFEREKKKVLESIANANLQASYTATNVFNTLLFDSTIKATPVTGTLESVKNITIEDVRKFHDENFSPAVAFFLVSGDATQEEITGLLRPAASLWKGNMPVMPDLKILADIPYKPVLPGERPLFRRPSKTKLYLVNKENAAQSEIRIGYVAIPADAIGNFFRLGIMNYPLGGSFNSRINLNLREAKGWTYGARTSFSGNQYPGVFMFSAGVKKSATDSAIREVLTEIRNYRQRGITNEELQFTRKALIQAENLRYESNFQKLGYLYTLHTYQLTSDYTKQQAGIVQSMSPEEINGMASAFLPVDLMRIVVVGDVKTIKPGLEQLGFEIILLDENGKPLKQ